ncbi:MAG TPA: response regulator [Longimicrobiales bacterium]|nr:response regulator [Longimicrobiales bacterium]
MIEVTDPRPGAREGKGAGTAGHVSTGMAPAADASAARPPRILVVDDEPLARQMFTDLLHAHGFEVVAVARGEEAFAFIPEVDLVLLDAMLPGRDGWSICREIKAGADPLFPVIMVTARTSPDDVVRTFAAGADDYVAKPFHVAELTARIESRLRAHRAERAIQEANRKLSEMARQNYELYERARKDAEERASLLRELDHRVRNNLSVIMGLLGMERNRRPSRPTAEALSSLENRLRAFLLVYEALKRQNYGGVPLREIIEKLAQRLRNAIDPARRIELDVVGDSLLIDEQQGFAVALTLNELITNALRHAFPEDRTGRIEIRMLHDPAEVRVEVADDGVGMPETGDGAEVLGSGSSIVAALVQGELGGRVERSSGPHGTTVAITFPRASDTPKYGAK